MAFDLDPSYKQVPERIADFKQKHPTGVLRPVDPARPYWFETVDGQTYLVYAAAAYRTPDDPTPGIGMAWEPVPGRTPYTKFSELQNAETSAWGRAIVAALASESKAVASAEDVRNRQADHEAPDPDPRTDQVSPDRQARLDLSARVRALTPEDRDQVRAFCDTEGIPRVPAQMSDEQIEQVSDFVDGLVIEAEHQKARQNDPIDPADTPPEAPVGAQETLPAEPGTTDPETSQRGARAAQVASEAGVDPAAVIAEDERRAKARDEAQAIADDLEGQALTYTLVSLDPDDDGKGSDAAKRKRLVEAMVREAMREDADGTLGV